MLATHTLYSKDKQPIEGLSGYLVGYIAECPIKKKNGGHFTVDWISYSIGFPQTVDQEKLETNYYSTKELPTSFQNAVKYFESAGGDVQSILRTTFSGDAPSLPNAVPPPPAAAAAAATTAASNRQQASTPVAASESLPMTMPVRFAAVANMMTSADSVSTMTHTLAASSRGPATRSNAANSDAESASNDGSEYDEDDNFWEIPEIITVDDGSDEEDEVVELRGGKQVGAAARTAKDLKWKFEKVTEQKDIDQHPHSKCPPRHEGEGGLRPGVATSFEIPTEAFVICGGFTEDFVKEITAETNDYFIDHIKKDLNKNMKYCGDKWYPVTPAEMRTFLGICLRISSQEEDAGGYAAYFGAEDRVVRTGYGTTSETKTLPGTKGWAQQYMRFIRYKQIRGAFHPMNKVAGRGGDKCYQLRSALNHLNAASKMTFVPSGMLAFDEGGVACRSRLCPVRQYNDKKPDKFRVDFFIFACSITYAILFIDVYQGKNVADVNIVDEAKGLPTTQKAVYNAVIKTGLKNDTEHGWRTIAMDNRYACPELCVLLRNRCRVLSTGTVKVNRKGWPKDIMNMEKNSSTRGDYTMGYDKCTRCVAIQWRDNRVVNCVSTITDIKEETTMRREGSNRRELPVPHPLKEYHRYMGGVDRGDQIRSHLSGFARKAHYKKWYKKAFFAVLDCMLMNSYIAWNESCKVEELKRSPLKKHEFYAWIADDLLNSSAKKEESEKTSAKSPREPEEEEEEEEEKGDKKPLGICSVVKMADKRGTCAVCRLDCNQSNDKTGMRTDVCYCSTCQAGTHMFRVAKRRKIHTLFPDHYSCHDILRSKVGREIWQQRTDGEKGKQQYTVRTRHPVVEQLRILHGLKPTKAKTDEDDASIAIEESQDGDDTVTMATV